METINYLLFSAVIILIIINAVTLSCYKNVKNISKLSKDLVKHSKEVIDNDKDIIENDSAVLEMCKTLNKDYNKFESDIKTNFKAITDLRNLYKTDKAISISLLSLICKKISRLEDAAANKSNSSKKSKTSKTSKEPKTKK